MPGCALCCQATVVDWKREAEGSNRGRGAFSKRQPSHKGLGVVGVGSAGSVLKVKGGVGGRCSQIKELEEGGLLFAQTEESQRDWRVTSTPETVEIQLKTRDCLQH